MIDCLTFLIHIKVQAEDNDRGENGRVTYSILRAPTNFQVNFRIDEDTGDVRSAVQFDREVISSYTLTIRGVDQGTPPLDGYCTFTISIGDINDNKPVFDLQSYTATISQTMDVGRSILTVRANDEDLGENAEIEYSMVDSDGGVFRIDEEAGIIFLNKTLGTVCICEVAQGITVYIWHPDMTQPVRRAWLLA